MLIFQTLFFLFLYNLVIIISQERIFLGFFFVCFLQASRRVTKPEFQADVPFFIQIVHYNLSLECANYFSVSVVKLEQEDEN